MIDLISHCFYLDILELQALYRRSREKTGLVLFERQQMTAIGYLLKCRSATWLRPLPGHSRRTGLLPRRVPSIRHDPLHELGRVVRRYRNSSRTADRPGRVQLTSS